ncbi:MAG: potassium channel family protein [Tractidigestivibacter sp.]|jgi:trk system potassium uptake protein TrkA|uniref:potassium channel family protein n=1 Tax=Tractidigestivibacter sp. TaxID=2847320 RepID=UPI003D91E58C
MRILVAGSNDETFYLVGSLLSMGNEVSLVCDNRLRAQVLSEAYDIEVIAGDPTSLDALDDVSLPSPDVFIALLDHDSDNFVACRTAKKEYGIPKTVCTVRDPRNVTLFKRLGITHAISAARSLAEDIDRATTSEDDCETSD